MKKLIWVLLAAACFVCAELKADDKPQGVVTKIERTYDKEGKLWLITFSYEKDGKQVGWLKIRRSGYHIKNVPHVEWSGGYPYLVDYDSGYLHLRKIGDGKGGYKFPYIFRPPNRWEKSIAPVSLSNYKWDDKCFIGFQLVQNPHEND